MEAFEDDDDLAALPTIARELSQLSLCCAKRPLPMARHNEPGLAHTCAPHVVATLAPRLRGLRIFTANDVAVPAYERHVALPVQ
eukprot:9134473-Prorocentrum_lima.AAC.1